MVTIQQYFVFYGSVYYPQGGMDDFIESFNDLDEAINFINKHIDENKTYDTVEEELNYRWAHIIDMATMEKVWSV